MLNKNLVIGVIGVLIFVAVGYFVVTGQSTDGQPGTSPNFPEVSTEKPITGKMLGSFDTSKYPEDSPTQFVAEIAGKLLESFS